MKRLLAHALTHATSWLCRERLIGRHAAACEALAIARNRGDTRAMHAATEAVKRAMTARLEARV